MAKLTARCKLSRGFCMPHRAKPETHAKHRQPPTHWGHQPRRFPSVLRVKNDFILGRLAFLAHSAAAFAFGRNIFFVSGYAPKVSKRIEEFSIDQPRTCPSEASSS